MIKHEDADGSPFSPARVKWFDNKKGFGFLTDPKIRGDIFVHFSVIETKGYRTLSEGEQVLYQLAAGKDPSQPLRAGRVRRNC